MKREEYLRDLKLKLEQDDFAQVEEAIAYFNDLLEDRMAEEGMDEEAAVALMDAPDLVASQLRGGPEKTAEQPQDEPQGPSWRSTVAQADQVRRILLRDRNMRLTVIGEKREDILIRHPESEKVRYAFTLSEGRLSLTREELPLTWQLFFWDGLPREMREVTLRVPLDLAAEMDLRTSNARLTLRDITCWGSLTAATSNGALSLENISAKSLSIKTSNAALSLSQASARQDLKAVTSNGKITARGLSAPGLTLKTSNASIAVAELESGDITLGTSNAAIKGTLSGQMADWTITSRTSNGKNTLPVSSQGGSRRLSAHTSNANISLKFTADAY